MSGIRLRLCSKRGESLIETLVSILVVAISSALLLGAISCAEKINREVRASDNAYRLQLDTAERGGGTIEDTLEIKMDIVGNPVYIYDVYYAGEEGKLRSYDKKKVVPPP